MCLKSIEKAESKFSGTFSLVIETKNEDQIYPGAKKRKKIYKFQEKTLIIANSSYHPEIDDKPGLKHKLYFLYFETDKLLL